MAEHRPTPEALDAQSQLRDAILDLIQEKRFIGSSRHSEIHAAVACMGAAAVMIALLPPAQRDQIAEVIADGLAPTVEKRAAEILSGEFDDAMARRRQ
ncbi:hypothetical protein V5F40_06860 [Xanthobacter sp. DSM 14520]|uniref:hypothetical protein n=1 Tax=Xanthobacter autotrophicus (strain ATCC BAA-1158 / Py2) TaxID=78245 RepID=UPI003729D662